MAQNNFLTVPRFAGLVSIALAGVCGLFGVYLPARTALGAAGWNETPCTVISSVVAEEEKTEPWGNSSRTYTAYSPAVLYRYEVDGNSHTSSIVTLKTEASRDKEWAEELVAKYPEGSEHTCYVDPNDPDAAILEPFTRTYEQYVFAAGALILLATGVFLFVKG